MAKPTAMEWVTLITAIIGALAWLPTIIPLLRPQHIQGRVISQYANFGRLPDGSDAVIFLQKLSLFVANRDFFLKGLEIYLKYPGSAQEEECSIWTWRRLTFTFPEDGPVQRRLAIDARDYLVHQTVLPHDQAVVGYVSFSSNHLADEKYEYVRYVFIDYQGRRKELVIRGTDVRDSETLFDDDIWK
jgi:hypothetical protein